MRYTGDKVAAVADKPIRSSKTVGEDRLRDERPGQNRDAEAGDRGIKHVVEMCQRPGPCAELNRSSGLRPGEPTACMACGCKHREIALGVFDLRREDNADIVLGE